MAKQPLEVDGDLRAPLDKVRFSEWRPEVAIHLQIALSAAFLLGLTLLVLGPVLFGAGDRVFSDGEADLARQFVHWRAFGFNELRAGHLALWNPHIFSGTPFFGGFQSALLYPPNWLYLCLPLSVAINAGIALHVFLAGLFMCLWVRQRGLHPLAGLLAGVLFMFGGPYFLHIYPGHLSNLCTMVWGPLIFLSIDGWLERRRAGWLWLGSGAVAMQILAGHPQYVFYTGVAAGLYCGVQFLTAANRRQALAGLAVLVVGAVGLSAVQLFEGLHVAGETVRNHGTSLEFAANFSFPPENLVTALLPGFFGDMNHLTYWGRFRLWEMSVFFGVTGFVLAIYGTVKGEPSRTRGCVILAVLCLLVALGSNTPLFGSLYHYAPGFGKFRGWSKFIYPATLFLIVLAATGFDAMLRGGRPPERPATGSILLAAVTLGLLGAWAAFAGGPGAAPWRSWVHSHSITGDLYQAETLVGTADFAARAGRFAAWQLSTAAGILLAIGVVFLLARRRPYFLRILLIIGTVEMGIFAHSTLTTFPLSGALRSPPGLPAGDYRVLNTESPNLGMSTGARDLWGYDPGVLRRYAEWMAVTQGVAADEASEAVHFWNFPRGFANLARCRYVLGVIDDDGNYATADVDMGLPAPRLSLVSDARVIPNRDELFATLKSPDFDSQRHVLLQTAPDPSPVADGAPGRVHLVAETSDTLTIEADLPQAAILLITDTYCTGWQAHSLLPESDSVQSRYNVLPADYFLRGIPLRAGHHKLLVEYRPIAFVVGKWVSLTSLLLYVIAGIFLLKSR